MKQQDELAARPVKQRPEAPGASICYLSRSSMDDAAQRPDPAARKTVHFVSLGCPKNRVDTEVMLGHTAGAGHELVADPEQAEVIVVNTCGFIGEAKQESIDAILEMARHKESGTCQRLVVAGCLSQRYPQELADGDARGRPLPRHRRGGPGRPTPIAGRTERVRVPETPRFLYDDLAPAPAVDGAAHRLREDRRGLRSPLRLLHHPQAARPAAQPRPAESVVREAEAAGGRAAPRRSAWWRRT